MRIRRGLAAAGTVLLLSSGAVWLAAQERRPGGFVPGQARAAEDPAAVARGKTLYGVHCTGCHGADLRGGDIGGPNLLRSMVALSDREGEAIVPIINGSRQNAGMPAIPMQPEDARAVAAYVRSVLETIGRQGTPPSAGVPVKDIVVGDAKAGKIYFDTKCASCHSAEGDLKDVAAKYPDTRMLQNVWVAGGGGGRRGGRGGPDPTVPGPRTVMAKIQLPSGEALEGPLVRQDDFFLTVANPDGTLRTVRRTSNTKVEVRDPMKAHRDLLAVYSDKDIHDVTAYLVTLK